MKILGCDYALTQEPLSELDNRGYFDGEAQTIKIASDIHPQAKEATLLHEILHALSFMLSIGINEKQVKQLEHGLYQVLTANGVSLAPLLES